MFKINVEISFPQDLAELEIPGYISYSYLDVSNNGCPSVVCQLTFTDKSSAISFLLENGFMEGISELTDFLPEQ